MKRSISGPSLPIPTTWVYRSSGTANGLAAVAANGATLVAIGGLQTVIYSVNAGNNWSNSSSGFSTTAVNDVIYADGKFVACGAGTASGNKIRYSSNGSSFSGATHPWAAIATIYGLAMGASNILAISSGSAPNTAKSTSSSGPFTAVTTPQSFGSIAIAADGSGSVVVGGLSGQIARSTDDGDTFSSVTSPTSTQWNKARWGNGKFLMIGRSGSNYQSSDGGATWSSANISTSSHLYDAFYQDGVWVVVGQSSFLQYSIDDMATWTSATSGLSGGDIFGVTFTEGRWVVVGSSGDIRTSDV